MEMSKAERKIFQRICAIGGRLGGKRSLETMTAEQRRDRASKAGKASADKRRKAAEPCNT